MGSLNYTNQCPNLAIYTVYTLVCSLHMLSKGFLYMQWFPHHNASIIQSSSTTTEIGMAGVFEPANVVCSVLLLCACLIIIYFVITAQYNIFILASFLSTSHTEFVLMEVLSKASYGTRIALFLHLFWQCCINGDFPTNFCGESLRSF